MTYKVFQILKQNGSPNWPAYTDTNSVIAVTTISTNTYRKIDFCSLCRFLVYFEGLHLFRCYEYLQFKYSDLLEAPALTRTECSSPIKRKNPSKRMKYFTTTRRKPLIFWAFVWVILPLLKAASYLWVMLCTEAFMATAQFVMPFVQRDNYTSSRHCQIQEKFLKLLKQNK